MPWPTQNHKAAASKRIKIKVLEWYSNLSLSRQYRYCYFRSLHKDNLHLCSLPCYFSPSDLMGGDTGQPVG